MPFSLVFVFIQRHECWRCDTDVTDAAKFAPDVTTLSGVQVTCSLSRESESVRCQSSFNNKSITTCTSGHSRLSFIPHKSRSLHPKQPPLAPAHYSHLSASCLNYFISVSLLRQSFSLAVFFCPFSIIWSICGWATNLRRISEPIYLLTLMHCDTLLPITFLCQAMSFWQDHPPA